MNDQTAIQMSEAARQMQDAAYVFSQSIAAMARIQGMVAENQHRLNCGEQIAYDEKAFEDVALEFGIYHNAVIGVLRR